MQAITVEKPGSADFLQFATVDLPKDELIVKTRAFALNRMDILQRDGKYPVPKGASPILGVEFSGIAQNDIGNFRKGDKVYGLVSGGAYAEYISIDQRMAMHIPPNLSFVQAAAIPEAWFTALQALVMICKLQKGENVLIHAGASGVGTAAIQIAKYLGAKHIIVTCGSNEKKIFCEKLGATLAINYKENAAFSSLVREHCNGVNVLIDFVGARYWNENLASLAVDGRMVMLAFLGGAIINESNLGVILRNRIQITGSTLRSRSLEYQIELKSLFEKLILPGIKDGSLRPIIDLELDWKEIKRAHQHMEANNTMGKVVMKIE